MAYVIVETETRHIYFLNCAYISRGINSSLDPFSKEIKRTYVNKADCEISRLRGARKIAFDYYAIYWDDHFALLFTKSPEFPLLEYILRNNGFDIETRIYCANELTSADVLVGCLFQLALIGGMIIGTLAAPIHASTITTLLYIILVTGSFLMAIWQGRRIMSYSISETTKEISRKDD